MPPKKGTYTPNNPPDSPTWTLDEGEEMCRDINDLQLLYPIRENNKQGVGKLP